MYLGPWQERHRSIWFMSLDMREREGRLVEARPAGRDLGVGGILVRWAGMYVRD